MMVTFNGGCEDFVSNASLVYLLALERANLFHHETFAGRHLKDAEFCSMTDSKHCFMQTKIIDGELEGLGKVWDTKNGAELAGVKMGKAD